MKWIYRLFKNKFDSYYIAESRHQLTHRNLAYWFTDNQGFRYYKFPDNMALPLERIANLKMLYSWLSAGISGEEMRSIVAAMKQALHDGLASADATAKIAALINTIEERMKYAFHLEIYYNIVATLAVRNDENPEVYNNDIQMQKVIAFKDMTAKGGTYFFFREKLSGTLINLSDISEIEWSNMLVESEVHRVQMQLILDYLKSRTKLEKKENNSEA